jgi:dihydroneopterin aldolase
VVKRVKLHKFTIRIEDLTFRAIIGVLDKERREAQEVVVDVEILYRKEGELFINYADVAKLIEEGMQKEQYFLLEEALEELSGKIKLQFPTIETLKLKLSKPTILDNCVVSAEIFKIY